MLGWLINRFRPIEARSSGAGYTGQLIAARESYISGRRGLAELTGTVQSCVSLWESAFALADVEGTDLLPRHVMAMIARSAALNGESVHLITASGLVPATDWDVTTRDGRPRAYRLSIPESGGARTATALAAEVLHLRLAADATTPWIGTAPLRRASLTAGMLHAVESALGEVFENAPLGSQIVPLPDSGADDMASVRASFRGRRGAVLVAEGTAQAVAAGMHPQLGQKTDQLSPDLSRSMTRETLDGARSSILGVYGVLPALLNPAATGPVVREAQRHLAGWILQPIAELLAEEASAKLGAKVVIDVGRPLQAFDAGGRARALSQMIEAMGRAKELGLSPEEIGAAFKSVNWGGGDELA